MKHKGFILVESLICGFIISGFLLFLLYAYGSTLTSMEHANILHQGLNLAEGVAAGKNMFIDGYTIVKETDDYKIICVKYYAKDLLYVYQAP